MVINDVEVAVPVPSTAMAGARQPAPAQGAGASGTDSTACNSAARMRETSPVTPAIEVWVPRARERERERERRDKERERDMRGNNNNNNNMSRIGAIRTPHITEAHKSVQKSMLSAPPPFPCTLPVSLTTNKLSC